MGMEQIYCKSYINKTSTNIPRNKQDWTHRSPSKSSQKRYRVDHRYAGLGNTSADWPRVVRRATSELHQILNRAVKTNINHPLPPRWTAPLVVQTPKQNSRHDERSTSRYREPRPREADRPRQGRAASVPQQPAAALPDPGPYVTLDCFLPPPDGLVPRAIFGYMFPSALT